MKTYTSVQYLPYTKSVFVQRATSFSVDTYRARKCTSLAECQRQFNAAPDIGSIMVWANRHHEILKTL